MPPTRIESSDWVCTREAAGGQRHVDAAGVPEAGVRRDVLVVGRVDEDLDAQRPAVLVERVRRDLAHLQAAEEDRRAGVERAEVGVLSTKKRPGVSPVTTGGVSRATKSRCFCRRAADLHADVGARDQGAEPGDVGARDARAAPPRTWCRRRRKSSVFGAICAVAMTLRWSSERRMVVSVPTSTPL